MGTATNRKLAYLCLQATREGQASFAHVHEIIKGLRKRGWQVDLYEPAYARLPREPRPIIKLLHFVGVQLQLLRMVRARQYTAVYIRHHPLDPITIAALRLLKIPLILEVNGPYEDLYLAFPWARAFRWLWTPLMRYGMRQADAVVTVTEPLVRWAQQEAGHSRVFLISNGVDAQLFRPEVSSPPPPGVRQPYTLFFGVLARWQGIEKLLEAIQHPDWPESLHLVIAGDGALRREVEQAARRSTRILYLGKLPYSQIPSLIQHSVCGLAPMGSIERNCTGVMPLKVFETLACGVPVVVSDLPGMADLVRQHHCGIVVPPGDSKQLANAVRYLLEHPEERAAMGKNGRQVVEREHSWDARAEATHRLLCEICKLC